MKKKTLLFTAVALALCLCAIFPAYAASIPLTPALDTIAEDCGMVKSGLRGGDLVFSISDFRQALGTSKFDSITVTTLPTASEGVLKLSGLRVSEGQEIDADYLGLLCFSPASAEVDESAFGFVCEDLSGSEIRCRLRVIDSVNRAPCVSEAAAVSLSAWTQKNLPFEGKLRASDPEGDAITYQVVKYPRKGAVTMKNEGSYIYTPKKNYTGDDSFTYVARDEYGNYSTVATVKVSVVARTSNVEYSDVSSNASANAVLVMTSRGIMNGKISGDNLLFEPDGGVTRSEFTVMAMKAAGIRPRNEAGVTFFDDDAEIPAGEKPYIALAQKAGYINGSFDGRGLYFRPNDNITAAEAAVIVGRILDLDRVDVSPVFAASEKLIPTWASIPASSLCSAGVVEEEWLASDITERTLTRLDTAELLLDMIRYININVK